MKTALIILGICLVLASSLAADAGVCQAPSITVFAGCETFFGMSKFPKNRILFSGNGAAWRSVFDSAAIKPQIVRLGNPRISRDERMRIHDSIQAGLIRCLYSAFVIVPGSVAWIDVKQRPQGRSIGGVWYRIDSLGLIDTISIDQPKCKMPDRELTSEETIALILGEYPCVPPDGPPCKKCRYTNELRAVGDLMTFTDAFGARFDSMILAELQARKISAPFLSATTSPPERRKKDRTDPRAGIPLTAPRQHPQGPGAGPRPGEAR